MSLGTKLQSVLENPARMKKIKRGFYAALALLVAGDFLIEREHAHFIWDTIPGFSAVYGFVSCVLIIVVSKFIGHAGLMKPENYYEPVLPLVERREAERLIETAPPPTDPDTEGGHSHP